MINRVVLVGRITKDPDLRKTSSGISVVQFTLAVNRPKNKDGEQEADFIPCRSWRGSADFMANYVKKGSLLGVEGKISTRNYEDKNGHKVYVTEVDCDKVEILNQKRDEQTANNDVHTYQSDFCSDTLDIDSSDLPF